MAEGSDKVLSERDKNKSMSDTVFARDVIRDAFPKDRHGSVKAAQSAAFSFIRKHVEKDFTFRRVRAIWEGTARRIDGEEKDALRRAQIEEAKREQAELRARLARLDEALAVADAQNHRGMGAPSQPQAGGLRGMDRRGG